MAHSEGVDMNQNTGAAQEFHMPVQWVDRPALDFRGFSGEIAADIIKPEDEMRKIIEKLINFDF